MTIGNEAIRALAVDLRQSERFVGVALVVPSQQYAVLLADGEKRSVERKLPADLWPEIDAWAAAGDAGLPARPAPLSQAVVSALLEGERPSATGQRFASIPLNTASAADLPALAERMLPELLKSRRTAD